MATSEPVILEVLIHVKGRLRVDANTASINCFVYAVISPILEFFINTTGRRNLLLQSREAIISTNGKSDEGIGDSEIDDSGMDRKEKIVVVEATKVDTTEVDTTEVDTTKVDTTKVDREEFILVVELNRFSTDLAMMQCIFTMKDAYDINGGGEIFGFVTTGREWRMIRYDGHSFEKSEEMVILLDEMISKRRQSLRGYSDVVDCIYAALSKGGTKKKDNQNGVC